MDIGVWLRSLGLEQYEAAAARTKHDTILPSVAAEELKDLAVRIVGHQRKLLNAIAALGADARSLREGRRARRGHCRAPQATGDVCRPRFNSRLFSLEHTQGCHSFT